MTKLKKPLFTIKSFFGIVCATLAIALSNDVNGDGLDPGGSPVLNGEGETGGSPDLVDPPPAIYVDSRSGSDLNLGSDPLEPLQTLAAAVAAAGAHQHFYLAKGSRWRESFDLRNIDSPVVDVYGEGDPPIIDGSDVVNGWSRVGETNIHEASFTVEDGGRWVVFEEGVMLKRIVDRSFPPTLTQAQLEALCDATPGSFVDGVGGIDGTPMAGSGQIQIHASTSDNPETNGKVYSISRRTSCIIAGDNAVIRGVQTMRAISNNGSIDLVNASNGSIERCLALDGTKHSIGFGSGHAKDSITLHNDPATHYEQSNTRFVAFLNDGTGSSALIERCGVIGSGNGVDIYSHGAPNPLDNFTARQLWFVENPDMYAGGANHLIGCYYRNVLNIPSVTGELSMVMADLDANGAASGLGNYGGVRMTDCAIKVRSRGDTTPINHDEIFRLRGATGPQIISHCAFYMEEPRPQLINNTNWFANFDSSQDLNFKFCVVVNGVNLMEVASGGSYSGDYNVFMANNRWTPSDTVAFRHPFGYSNTLSGWQNATGQDSNSVYLAFNDQVRGNPHAFWRGVANDGNDGPIDGDFRINPQARVYDSSDVAHIGTFADGTTPITEAGPQQHWDWNTRAGSAGPPARWPSVPDNLAKARKYISEPESWDFYPVLSADITDWRQIHFDSPENGGDGADRNDHDNDGIPNLTEYAFGLNPVLNSAGQLPEWRMMNGHLVTRFTEPPGVLDITYGAEWSFTMAPDDWHAITDSGMEPEHTFSVPAGGEARRFVRFKISSP